MPTTTRTFGQDSRSTLFSGNSTERSTIEMDEIVALQRGIATQSRSEQLSNLGNVGVLRVPQNEVQCLDQPLGNQSTSLLKGDDTPEVVLSEDFIHQRAHPVNILIADLHE